MKKQFPSSAHVPSVTKAVVCIMIMSICIQQSRVSNFYELPQADVIGISANHPARPSSSMHGMALSLLENSPDTSISKWRLIKCYEQNDDVGTTHARAFSNSHARMKLSTLNPVIPNDIYKLPWSEGGTSQFRFGWK